jgi:hypothetical protein
MFDGFAPLVAAVSLIWALVRFGKQLLARQIREAVTQLITWGAGVGVVALLAASDFAAGIEVAGLSLAGLNAGSLVLLGMTAASTASTAYEFKKSLDNTESAAEPKPTFSPGPGV